MQAVLPRLFATDPVDLGFAGVDLRARSFVVQADEGNVLLYGAGPAVAELDAVRDLGGVRLQLLNHVHEAAPAANRIREAFGAPLHVHAADAAAVGRVVGVDATFEGRRHLTTDIEAIPIPGHTPGATAFLWTADGRRVLFTGDSVTVLHGRWVAALLPGISDRDAYVASLEALAREAFEVLAPGAGDPGAPAAFATDPAQVREQLLAIAARLRGGGDR
jgi:glyoxylase-like metal-dependent hydrolase (beta-lactamase superfamily II)